MKEIIAEIRDELKKNADPRIQIAGQRFFKEKVQSYGVKTAMVMKIAKPYDKRVASLDNMLVFALCEDLWRSGIMEESFIACHWSYLIRKKYLDCDLKVFEKWIELHVSNWASCDTLCNHSVGSFIDSYPQRIEDLKKWAQSRNRWFRRAAAVSLIIPARRGKFLGDIFSIAGILLEDKDDMVQKGYGWMLKSASQAQQKEVFDFVMNSKSRMPRTALRYAIEKMPRSLKAKAMEK